MDICVQPYCKIVATSAETTPLSEGHIWKWNTLLVIGVIAGVYK